ncbi:GNAT family protein [Lasiodiplodia theobromae]|uniref:GNAT family protein n=1 Tax=Lasiodiplodia theobromae TaxID=45133 RepID=UPI0015C3B7C6|nr:GNAT family protein [Lasiodiplodia theobromae]KAF4545992.1 GNAT family protein [Lasiodiplodia theobromae]
MPLHLSRATTDDIRALVDLHYDVTGTSPLTEILIGYDTEACRRAATERWTREAAEDPADLWLKVVDVESDGTNDDDGGGSGGGKSGGGGGNRSGGGSSSGGDGGEGGISGRIVSAAHWKVYPSWPEATATMAEKDGSPQQQQQPWAAAQPPVELDWMAEGSEQRALGEKVVRKFYARRAEMQHGKPHVLLNRLYTHPDYRSRGCASALVRNGCEMADRLFLPVWVESSPVAERLYLSMI